MTGEKRATLDAYDGIVHNVSSLTLVLAGPGAGKTCLLADRVRWLLQKGTDKDSITVLTFGTDARHHMYEELSARGEGSLISFTIVLTTMLALGACETGTTPSSPAETPGGTEWGKA